METIKSILKREILKLNLSRGKASSRLGIPKVRLNNILSGRNSCLSMAELVKIHTVLRCGKFCDLLGKNNWGNYERYHSYKPKVCVMCGNEIVNKDDHVDCYVQIMQDRSESLCIDIASQLSSRHIGMICHRIAKLLKKSESDAYKMETLIKRKLG